MYRTVAIAAVVLALLLTTSMPASAQTWFQFRYWSTGNGSYESGNTFNSGLAGVSIRRNFMDGDWAASFNLDTGGVSSWTGGGGTQAFNRFWNLNVHRNFTWPMGAFSIYAGYGGAVFEDLAFPWYLRQTGWRIGLDGTAKIRDNWFVTADVGYTLKQATFNQLNWNLGGDVRTNATILDYKAAVGYRLSDMWSAELGYRRISWDYNANVMCGGPPCGVEWKGFYLGLNLTAP